jgi:tetratricopeptide (TPR) repeat protein
VGEGIEALYHERLDEYYDELAYHYSLSDDLEKAVSYLVKAGDKAKEMYANTEALGYYNHALRVLEELPDASSRGMGDFPHMPEERKSIYKGIAHIYGMMGRDDESLDLYKKALEYCEDRVERAAIKGEIGYGYLYSTEDKSDLAWEYLNAAIKELGEDTQSVEMARILARLGYFYCQCKHEPEKTVECCLRSLKILEGTEDYKEMSWTYWCLGLGYAWIGDVDKAMEFFYKSLEVSEEAGVLRVIANACNTLSEGYIFIGDVDTALEYTHRCLDMCKKIEYFYIGFYACARLSKLYSSRGEWDTAAKYCREGLDWAIELNTIGSIIYYYYQLEEIYERQGEISKISGEYEKGFAAVKEKLRLEPDNPAVLNIAAWYCVKMEIELEEALTYAQKAVQLSHSSQNLGTLGWVYLKLGQFEEALEQFRGALLLKPRRWASETAWGGVSEVASSDVDAEIFLKFYRGMMEEASEDVEMKERLHAAMAQFHLKRGSVEDAMTEFARTGCPWNSSWMVIGPFDNTNNAAIEREYPPETEKEIDLDAAYQGKEGEVRWIEFEAEHVSVEVNFNDVFASDGWSVAYALIYVISPADREAQLKVTEVCPSIRVWLNDDVVFDKNPFVRTPKENVVPISLQEGRNKILAKICQACGEIPGWRLYLRITDSEGKPFDDLKYVSASESIM